MGRPDGPATAAVRFRVGCGWNGWTKPISSLSFHDLLVFYFVLDVLDDSNPVWPTMALAVSLKLSMALVGQLGPDLIVLDGIDGIRPWIPLSEDLS